VIDMKTIVVAGAVLVGLAFIALAGHYWLTPAGALPAYVPGFEEGSVHIHFKHGLGMLILGLGALAFAWFRSGAK
jgi:hypothetical protein